MKIGEFTRQGGSMSAEHQQQSATPRHLSKGSIIFIIVTLVTFLVISLISLAVLSTLFVWKKTNTETGFHNPRIHITTNVQQESTAQTTLDPTHHCQEDAPEPKSCEDGWFFSNRSCYWYNPEELTWNDAEAACRLQTATLAEIISEEEWNFVTTFNIRPSHMAVWVAGRYSEEHKGWEYSCSKSLKTFTDHDGYLPIPGSCELLDLADLKFRNYPCSNEYASICEGNFKYT